MWIAAAVLSTAGVLGAPAPDPQTAAATVRERERAFAKTMADRDLAAFEAFLADEAIFLSGNTPLRGRAAVVAGWKKFYEGPSAPFSWEPETVEVIDSGSLALSRGPVFDPSGRRVGTFTSTWRREPDGVWKIVLDSGCPPCPCPAAAAAPATTPTATPQARATPQP